LNSIVIPASVTSIGSWTFSFCTNLSQIFFAGNAPSLGGADFNGDNTIVYYFPAAQGWSSPFAGCPAQLWNPAIQTSGSNYGVHTNGFGFLINGTTNIPIVVEASINLSGPWTPVQSASLTNGLLYFNDPQYANYPARYYKISPP
jgi:hypothetical protein